jgi:hypothetical protein
MVEMRQCDAERLGIDRKTRGRMKRKSIHQTETLRVSSPKIEEMAKKVHASIKSKIYYNSNSQR